VATKVRELARYIAPKYRQRNRVTYVAVACAAASQGMLLLLLVPRLGASGAIAYAVSLCGTYGVFAQAERDGRLRG
jgi:hypothetical protein